MWIKVKFFTISCISSNLNRVEKQLLPVGGEKQAVNGPRRCEGSSGGGALTVLAHVVDRQDRWPASGAGAVEGGVDDAVGGLDAVLLEGETLISRPRHKMHICPPVWQKHAENWWRMANKLTCPWSRSILAASSASWKKQQQFLSMFGLFLWVYSAAKG